jgi:hypothetical protein
MAEANNVFISWSGERSKAAAEALREWLPIVLQVARPWMSETDIEKGSRGLEEIGKALEVMKVGIICLTPENLTAEWINYEAGALSKTPDAKTRVCTYLLAGLEYRNVKPPLGLFQWTKANRDDTRKLIHTINKHLDATPVPDSSLDAIFAKMWPDLEQRLSALPASAGVVPPVRTTDEMVAEILELSRAAAQSRKLVEGLDEYVPTFKQFMPVLAQLAPFLSEALKAAPKPAPPQGPSAQVILPEGPIRKVFRVKQRDDAEIKRIEGLNAYDDGAGILFVVDERGKVLARLANVEEWWPEPPVASIGGKIEPQPIVAPGEMIMGKPRAADHILSHPEKK